MQESAAVQAERKRLVEEWEAGLVEGYDENVNRLPVFFFKPYSNLTARQRGYVIGREIRLMEMAEGE